MSFRSFAWVIPVVRAAGFHHFVGNLCLRGDPMDALSFPVFDRRQAHLLFEQP